MTISHALLLSELALALCVSSAAIRDTSWGGDGNPEPLWVNVTRAVDGHSTECSYLGSHVVPNISDFPAACRFGALALGGDTFDAKPDRSKCYIKKCGAFADMKYTDKYGGQETQTLLVDPWTQLSRADEGLSTDCAYLGSFELTDPAADFPQACQSKAMILGGDTFDVKVDRSKCYFKKCGALGDLKYTDKFGARDSFSVLLTRSFEQVTSAAENASTDCAYLGSFVPPNPAQDFPFACHSVGITKGADTFDAKVDGSKCYFKKCGALADIKFTAKFGALQTYTTLGGRWAQLTQAADGMSVDCAYLGSLEVSPADRLYPQACYSHGLVHGADTFDAKADGSKCYFKKCGAFADVKFTDKFGARESHTILARSWAQIMRNGEGISTDCTYLGSLTPPADTMGSSLFLQACYSQCIIAGGDTTEVKADGSKCYFKRCGAFPDIKFTDKFGGNDVYTILFPRGGDGWGPCDPSDCLDLTLLYTADLRGRLLPVGTAGETCDPDDSRTCFGGNARRISYINSQREKLAAKGEAVVALDLGGSVFGGPVVGHPSYAYGVPATLLQNLVPYDICIMSESDFLTKSSNRSRSELAASYTQRACPYLMSNAEFRGHFAPFQAQQATHIVKETAAGWKVCFFAMFPFSRYYGSFGSEALDLDPSGTLRKLLDGELGAGTFNSTRLKAEFEDVQNVKQGTGFVALSYQLATLVSIDLLQAVEHAKREHPDIRALILLVGSTSRTDQLDWLAQHGPFDAILAGRFPYEGEGDWNSNLPKLVPSTMHSKSVVVAGGDNKFGIGSLKMRLSSSPAKQGVQKFAFSRDLALDGSVEANSTAQELSSNMYSFIRERTSQPFGSLEGGSLTGSHRTGEVPPSKKQCYYTDCAAGEHVGRAFLWKAREEGYRADVSFYNLGGFRAVLHGDENRTVYKSHCIDTLSFQNTLELFSVLGKDLYSGLKEYIVSDERGFIGAGLRTAMHEPCWDWVNHTTYEDFNSAGPPGSEAERETCREALSNPASIDVILIDMQIEVVDFDACDDMARCDRKQWRTLEKGSTYTVVSTSYVASQVGRNWVPLGVSLDIDADALCEYIDVHSPLQVDTLERYRARGNVQYDTAAQGWAAGNRVPSVKTSISRIEAAKTCPGGMYLPENARACEPCPAGTKSTTLPAMDRCELCGPGFGGQGHGASACSPCMPGTFQSSAGQEGCGLCSPGTYSDGMASYCNNCKAGSFAPVNGSDECIACPVGTYSMQARASSCEECSAPTIAAPMVTRHPGATSYTQCVCPSGKYKPVGSAMECEPCPEGVSCLIGSNLQDFVAANRRLAAAGTAEEPMKVMDGYMTKAADPLRVYACMSQAHCPGGPPGTCASFRDPASIACSVCAAGGYTPSGEVGGCVECSGSHLGLFVLCALGASACLLAFYASTSRSSQSRQTHTSLLVGIMVGMFVTSMQQFGMLYRMNVAWKEPIRSLLSLASLVNFEWEALHLGCIMAFDPVGNYSMKALAVFACLGAVCFLYVAEAGLRRWPLWEKGQQLMNASGTLMLAFTIAVSTTAAAPFECDGHPSGDKTVRRYPMVVCWEGETHRNQVVIGTMLFVVPLTFLCLCFGVLWLYPKKVVAEDMGFLASFHWLFRCFQPAAYWYGVWLACRNLLFAMTPILPGLVLQISILSILMLTSLLLTTHIGPWKTHLANISDVCTSTAVLFLLIMSTFFIPKTEGLEVIAYFCSVAFVAAAATIIGIGAFGTYMAIALTAQKPFEYFVCHHKAHGAAQARYLQLKLAQYTRRPCFIDSDDLRHLDSLLDTVKSKVRHMVIYLTSDTLRRPWCAAELAVTWQTHQRLTAVLSPSFAPPTDAELVSDRIPTYLADSSVKLIEYGVTHGDISSAFMWLLSTEVPKVQMCADLDGRAALKVMTEQVLEPTARCSNPDRPSVADPVLLADDMVILSTRRHDYEAMAAAAIIMMKMAVQLPNSKQTNCCMLAEVANERTSVDVYFAKCQARAVLLILSEGSWTCEGQLQDITDAVDAPTAIETIPVFLPSFSMPAMLLLNLELVDRYGDDVARSITRCIQGLLKHIGLNLCTHGSDRMLDMQTLELIARIPSQGSVCDPVQSVSSTGFGLRSRSLNNRDSEASVGNSVPAQRLMLARAKEVARKEAELEVEGIILRQPYGSCNDL